MRLLSKYMHGSPFQRGYVVIARFIDGLFRKALPFLKRGARAVGKEALRAGMNIIDDVSSHQITFKESLRSRIHESSNNLKRKAQKRIESLMKGSVYKRQVSKRKNQSKTKRRKRLTSRVHERVNRKIKKSKKIKSEKNKKKRSVYDIFGPAEYQKWLFYTPTHVSVQSPNWVYSYYHRHRHL